MFTKCLKDVLGNLYTGGGGEVSVAGFRYLNDHKISTSIYDVPRSPDVKRPGRKWLPLDKYPWSVEDTSAQL